jgi:DNA-binding FadR family transcriptional regulator
VSDVIAKGWPVGELLGSEAELLDRYQVSRAVFREAVRLVEHQQVARTRRGPGGGLVITEPTVDAVIDAVVLYLYRVEAPLDELFEARIVLEEIASDLAPGRLDEQDLNGLRAFVDAQEGFLGSDPRELHALIASLSRNPALELFVEVLNRGGDAVLERLAELLPRGRRRDRLRARADRRGGDRRRERAGPAPHGQAP